MPPSESPVATAAIAAAKLMQQLAPGPLAELRRMSAAAGAPGFWRLAAQHPTTIGHPDRQKQWVAIVRMLAILTSKGDPSSRADLHDSKRRLGRVLCEGGDPTWEGPNPKFSERRLTQLIASRSPQRTVLLERAIRALAQSRLPTAGLNVIDIAWAELRPDDGRLLAEPYYRRLDRATVAHTNSTEESIRETS